jgi:hypothetical protein
MQKVKLIIELTLIAPFITKSNEIGEFGIDAPLAKSLNGKYQFPRKLIKGCLKQAWNEIADVIGEDKAFIEKWLGDKSEYEKDQTKTSVEPNRGKLFFSDFVTDDKGNRNTATKISIDAERGAVKENHLLVIETPFKPQEKVKFKGTITYFVKDDIECEFVKNRILKGLKWITNLGALENINFGQLNEVELKGEVKNQIQYSTQTATNKDVFDLILKPQEPFCISKRRTTENLFESEEFISGGVIKGCIAETLKLISDDNNPFTELKNNCHLIRFTHAFPSKNKTRPIVIPLSFVKIKSDKDEKHFAKKYNDVWKYKNAILIKNESPAFSVDWKNSDDIDMEFGWEHPKTVLSVQTAIENNKAKDGKLFAYEKINPDGFEWLGKIDLSKVNTADKDKVEKQLRCVFATDLFGLGKTKAICKAEMLDENSCSSKMNSDKNPKDNKFIITLQTPFLLCNPQNLNESSWKDELFGAYKETWEKYFDNFATLSHFFHSQSLAGGEYLHKRFQSDKAYNPFLLTDAGSVFVFDVIDETNAKGKIEYWLKHGLPLPDWAETLYGNNWQTCPFLPENGFGEIAVNLDVHWKNQPTEVTEI